MLLQSEMESVLAALCGAHYWGGGDSDTLNNRMAGN